MHVVAEYRNRQGAQVRVHKPGTSFADQGARPYWACEGCNTVGSASGSSDLAAVKTEALAHTCHTK